MIDGEGGVYVGVLECDVLLGAVGSLWDVVRDRRLNHRPEVVAGVLAAESTALLDGFFASHRAAGLR